MRNEAALENGNSICAKMMSHCYADVAIRMRDLIYLYVDPYRDEERKYAIKDGTKEHYFAAGLP